MGWVVMSGRELNRVEVLAQVDDGRLSVDNAANMLDLTTQVPVRPVFLTSGRSRKMTLGKQTVELRHVPRWQLTLAHPEAGAAVRALAWLGPGKADGALKTLKRKLSSEAFEELVSAAPQYPAWLAQGIGKAVCG